MGHSQQINCGFFRLLAQCRLDRPIDNLVIDPQKCLLDSPIYLFRRRLWSPWARFRSKLGVLSGYRRVCGEKVRKGTDDGVEEIGIEEGDGSRSVVSVEDTKDGPGVCGEVAEG